MFAVRTPGGIRTKCPPVQMTKKRPATEPRDDAQSTRNSGRALAVLVAWLDDHDESTATRIRHDVASLLLQTDRLSEARLQTLRTLDAALSTSARPILRIQAGHPGQDAGYLAYEPAPDETGDPP